MAIALGIVAAGIIVFTLFIVLSCCIVAGEVDEQMEQIMRDYKGEDYE